MEFRITCIWVLVLKITLESSSGMTYIRTNPRLASASRNTHQKMHYGNLRRLYFNIVLTDPVAVLKIYAGKLGSSLLVAADNDMRKLAKAGLAILIILIIVVWLRRCLKSDETIVALGTWGGFGTVMLQWVLAQPFGGFISPGKLGALCGIIVLVEAVGRSVAVRLRENVGISEGSVLDKPRYN